MTSFDDVLAAAKAAPRPHEDVQVLLNDGLSAQREILLERLDKAQESAAKDKRLTAANPDVDLIQAELDALLAEAESALITLRFTRMDGRHWSEITARCPIRKDVAVDHHYSYNMHAVCALAAPLSGVRVEGEELIPLRVEPATDDTPAVNQWTDLFKLLSGHEFGLVMDAVYKVNEYVPAMNIGDLKKALGGRPA